MLADCFNTEAIKLKKMFLQIELLELSANVLGDQGVLSLTSCLAKVMTLLLVNCSITPAHAKTLADALRLLDQPVPYYVNY